MVSVQPRTQIVEWMFACVTSGFSTPGVRTGSAAYGPLDDVACGQTIAAPSRRTATDASAVRIDMRSKVQSRFTQRKMSQSAMAQPMALLGWATVLTTNQKGALAEGVITCEAIRFGIDVFKAVMDARYDLVF